jgi:multisubunit Na+/H+ antiporter MnhG subunit
VLITLFLFITAPVSAHLLAKAAMQRAFRAHRVPVASPGSNPALPIDG